jgi:hypothetical protein
MIFLDLDTADYERRRVDESTELAIEIAASLANHIIVREALPAGLATVAHDPLAGEVRHVTLPPRGERAQLLTILETLARVQMIEGGEFAATLRRDSVRLSWGTSVVAITGTPSEDVSGVLLYLRRGGFAVSLVLVQPGGTPGAAVPGVATFVVRGERDLGGWR